MIHDHPRWIDSMYDATIVLYYHTVLNIILEIENDRKQQNNKSRESTGM